MKFKTIFQSAFYLLFATASFGQDSINKSTAPKIFLEFAVLDLPYLKDAAQAFSNHRQGEGMDCNCKRSLGDYIKSYSSPSMDQSIQMTKNLYGTVGYFTELGTRKLFRADKSKGRKLLSKVSGEIASLFTTSYLMAAPFGQAWVHEEFHRNVLSSNKIYSVDDVWKFKGGTTIAVSNVLDQDLINFKRMSPQDHIRMSAAGIEGEIQFARNYQMGHFFKDLNTPLSGPYLLFSLGAVGYISSTNEKEELDEELRKMNNKEFTIRERDFTGHDIASWVYDLFNPFQPFQSRGVHPTGIGIDRYINPKNDFTDEMTKYADKMSRRSVLNLASPSVIGVSKIKLKENVFFNLSLRHTLTSFGDDRQVDLLYKDLSNRMLVSYHNYSNKAENFSGVELQTVDKKVNVFSKEASLNLKVMYWNQPEKLLFEDVKGKSGGALELQIIPNINKWYKPYLEIEAKTKGWLAGNTYQNAMFGFKVGFKSLITQSQN
ncbi:MAG TPA: hypothetical protein VF622_11415 [Segetibacter sp.]|jgi:hypothetical protein